ncbi:MAG TPA: acyltransferase family protein, partial [Gemmatimonadaceae bacterium]
PEPARHAFDVNAERAGSWRFRPDIEGLRAVAILLVVLYHAGWRWMSAGYLGVDVFFVLSGFLITGILIDEVAKTGRVSLTKFWARRARRLLPAATCVVLVVLVVDALITSPFQQIVYAHSARAFAVYASNVLFALRGVNYFAPDLTRNPLVHTWSLSVEEQFYLFFAPLVLLLALWAGRDNRVRFYRRFEIVAVAVSVISFVGCLALLERNWVIAFYSLPSRAWEFGLGAMTTVATRRIESQRGDTLASTSAVSNIVAVAALIALVAISATLGDSTAHPGWVTLIPTLATVGLILTGAAGTVVGQALSTRPMRAIGRLSYSWYLWHWPCLVWLREVVPNPSLGLNLAVAVASLAPAALTYWLIESPIRFSKRLQRLPVQTVVGAVAVAIITFAASTLASHRATTTLASPRFAAITEAATNLAPVFTNGCNLDVPDVRFGRCTFGPGSNDTTIVLIGDSHAAHWFPTLLSIADARGWRLASFTKSACPAVSVTVVSRALGRDYRECDAWREVMFARIDSLKPAIVILASYGDKYELSVDGKRRAMEGAAPPYEIWKAALQRSVTRLAGSGARVIVLQDTPHPGFSVPDCLAKHVDQPTACTFEASRAVDPKLVDTERAAVDGVASAAYIRTFDLFCDASQCPAERDGVVRYQDDHHISAKFATSLAPELSKRITATLR